MEKILLPVDGSHSAQRAIEYVVATNEEQRREIHLLNVQLPMRTKWLTPFPVVEMMVRARRNAGDEVLRPVRALLAAQDIDYTAQVLLGDPAETIARCAAERGCTSIVMGTRGMNAIGTLVLGSVATKVVNLTDIPVTLIPQPRETNIAALPSSSVREQYTARRQRRIETRDVIQGS
jgi:nucleotide-binding universal stress UspA family protein